MVIREALPEEHAALGRLMIAAYSTLEGFADHDAQPEYFALMANIGTLAVSGVQLLVAVTAGELLGGVVYFAELAHYGVALVEPDTSAFRLLAVAPAARGLGIGKALAVHCVELARARRHRQVIIHTSPPMAIAWPMYERMGFVRVPELDFIAPTGLPISGFRLAL